MSKNKKLLTALFLTISIFPFAIIGACAQTTTGTTRIVVSGTSDETGNLSINLYGNPGETLQGSTTVTNLSSETLKIKTELQDFIVESETGIPTAVESGSSVWSMSTWIGVPTELQEFELESNETKEVKFTIDIPQDATPGGHYTMILFTPVIVQEDVVGPLVENKVGNLVKLTVSGDIEENAEIVEFSAPYFSEYGPIPLTLKILNSGNTHVPVEGTVIIKNTIGQEVAEWEIQSGNVFPTAVRLWETTWEGKWRFGIYKAEANLTYGSGDLHLTEETYFWVIPWKAVLGIVAVIIFLIIIGYNKEKRKEVIIKNKIKETKSNNKLSQKTKLIKSKDEEGV